MKQSAFAGCAMLFLAACWSLPMPMPEPVPVPEGPDLARCGADALQGLVGQPATVLDSMKFAAPIRILRPGMAVTMDYSPDRLNIEIDAAEQIVRVQCG
jgi:hypothetical protein